MVRPESVASPELAPGGDVDALRRAQARCAQLEEQLRQVTRINTSLMDRVERDMDRQGNSFSLFQAATVLESQVNERTAALRQAMRTLEQTNRDLHESNQAAQAASLAKSAFLAAMSHELRTPMNGVIGMTDVLLNSELTGRQRKSLDTIRRSALSLLRILNDILDFSKIEAGHMQLEETAFDLRRTVEQTMNLLRPHFDGKGLELRCEWPDDLPVGVVGDPTRFAQIVTNLLGNALKFTQHGFVRWRAVVLAQQAGSVTYRFTIEDTGIGIRAAVLPRLFSSFTQADSSTTRVFGGSGLGLAIVRRLCELMRGECGVSSEFGKGSTFWFTLTLRRDTGSTLNTMAVAATGSHPLVQPPGAAGGAAAASAEGAARRVRVLIVEDNLINQEVARAILDSLHCESSVAANGRAAIEALAGSHGFDLVLMDCQMPELDGYEATRRLREREARLGQGRLPIIALTANAMAGDRDLCLAAGMDDFLSKPFQISELASLLRRWCPPPCVTAAAPAATPRC